MASKRTKATSISNSVRWLVYERDNKCIFCHRTYNITLAHFISRASSGLGIKENLACVCMDCHRKLDQSIERKTMLEKFRQYLDNHYPGFTDEERKYKK